MPDIHLLSVCCEPVSVAQVKKQLRINHDEDDAYLAQLIKAARIKAELFLNRKLVGLADDEEVPVDIVQALFQWVVAAYDAKEPLSLSQLLIHRRAYRF
ncbi:MAG: phage head-tail connector protein [Alphaproteobacteria bacterium]|nr:phage head-tail connector protein [Alphaproteobacteria bacterium]